MGLVLAMYGNEIKIGQALFISAFSMIVVFLVLLIISYLIDITAFFIQGNKKKVKVNTNVVTGNIIERSKAKKDNATDDNIVAIIAAAVVAYTGTSADNLMIKSIRRVPQSDTPWTERGLLNQVN